MTTEREQLLDRMARIYGLEHEITIDFARLLESPYITDRQLRMLVKAHKEQPIVNEDYEKEYLDEQPIDDDEEEIYDDPIDLEMGFNPYEGCYDFDC